MACYDFLSLCFLVISTLFVGNTEGIKAIIGGEKAASGQFPYQVLLQFHSENRECGGGIIGEQWILSAAHCLYKRDRTIDTGRITVLAGTMNMMKTESPAVRVAVQKVYFPRHYVHGFTIAANDIALLKLVHPLVLLHNRRLKKLELPRHAGENFDGEKAMIAGFGWSWINKHNLEQGGHNSTRLRFAEADVLHVDQHESSSDVPPALIWARIEQHKNYPRGACVGDSGGPLVHNGDTVIGILSGGPSDCSEIGIPSAYTDVSMYLFFIDNVLRGKDHEDIDTIEILH